jgi:ribosome-binding protein aMBF1 (putative translation factor)
MAKKKTTDVVAVLHARYIKGNPKRLAALEREREKLQIAGEVYDRRTQAGLSQARLAKLAGTTQSVISRLEDADYHAHSLDLLRRIARALNCRLEVCFVPERKKTSEAK